jgi:hypothetical protein
VAIGFSVLAVARQCSIVMGSVVWRPCYTTLLHNVIRAVFESFNIVLHLPTSIRSPVPRWEARVKLRRPGSGSLNSKTGDIVGPHYFVIFVMNGVERYHNGCAKR